MGGHRLMRGVLAFLVLIPLAGLAQLNTGGSPYSTVYAEGSAEIPVRIVEPPDMDAVQALDVQKPVPYRFAVDLPCPADLVQEGLWITHPDQSRTCLYTIEAPGARAVSVRFERFVMPEGARLYLYSQDKRQLLGAFTALNNHPSGLFSTQLIHGDRVTLEYNAPVSVTVMPELLVRCVAYAYRGVPDPDQTDGFGGSGPCEVNINCEEGQAWQEIKKGVVRIQAYRSGSAFWCTGSMINNVRQDGLPYLLTADHCYKDGTPDDLLDWIFYFGYETDGCEDPPFPPQEKALTGATLKARGGDVSVSGSDFLLLLLNDEVPDTFDVFLNGWNRINTPPASGVGIHHPQGDIKKISTYRQKATSTSWLGTGALTHWLVYWNETTNGHGVTEGGSSGSPLFDSTGMIVGALTGGGSTCDSANLNEPDYYGKLSYSWATLVPDTARLDIWLDPDGTGTGVLAGKALVVPEEPPTGTALIYPNPTSGRVTVVLAAFRTGSPATVTLTDMKGIPFRTEIRNFEGSREEFDLTGLPGGVWLMRITGDDGTMVRKIIKY